MHNNFFLALFLFTSSLFAGDGGDHPTIFTIRNAANKKIEVYQPESNHILGRMWVPKTEIEPRQTVHIQGTENGLKLKIIGNSRNILKIPSNQANRTLVVHLEYSILNQERLVFTTH